jgi:pyrimidine-nucleoside phosphorylase
VGASALSPYRVIQRKRDGEALSAAEIADFFGGYLTGEVADYQVAALLMAIHFRGLDAAELDALVAQMLGSGEIVDLGHVAAPKVDKHSTGGVGDKVSIPLAPLVASLGVAVPMMSGRGLGHTGGTVDKLETIPGFRLDLPVDRFRAQVARIGCALVAQSDAVAPLDRKLYALRDVTATVESVPLIASSIMSKKIACGLDGLVLDVKIGNGALMPERADAERLARTMIGIGAAYGVRTIALLTAMDRPLGHAIGNALEIEESIEVLRGAGPADVRELTLALAAEMLVLGGAAPDLDTAAESARAALDDGRALDKMRAVIAAQGGDPAVLDDPALLPQAPVRRVVEAHAAGVVTAMDVRAIGHAAVDLGAGRRTLDARIDPGVGFHVTTAPGAAVERGEPIATVYAADDAAALRAAGALLGAIAIAPDGAADPLPLIAARLA